MSKLVGIDFEFFDAQEPTMALVACSLQPEESPIENFNLLERSEVIKLRKRLAEIREGGDTLVAYAAIAEARCLHSLGFNPLHFKWIDLYVEFIMLCNSNNRFAYGDYINNTNTIATSYPVNPREEDDGLDHTETPKNLINCAFKLLKVRLDAKHKDDMRDLILSKDIIRMQENMPAILEYCASDTKYLIPIYHAICKEFRREGARGFLEDQLSRGRYSAAVSLCEQTGIPINLKMLDKIIAKTSEILGYHEKAVNEHFPFFVPETSKPPKVFKNGKIHTYKPVPAHKDMKSYQTYVESLNIEGFPKTQTGKYKSDKATLEVWGYWGGLEALWKYNKMESCLKWFNKDNKNGFFDRVGSDGVVRPFYGIFGTQTGRNAAKAKTFPLAMSAWLRVIVQPVAPECIIGADFSQQEVYVAAKLSGDQNLLDAYNSGDVYLAFAKQAGLVPQDGTKDTHKHERDLCKSTVLGLQFCMGFQKLKVKLKLDTKKEVSDDMVTELIAAHKRTYSQYWTWVREVSNRYSNSEPLVTADGWIMFTDNPVMTSVRNFPVQANAASITRLALVRAQEAGLKVMCTLHDAVYVLSKNVEEDTKKLEEIMKDATARILEDDECTIRIDTKVVSSTDLWIEDKALADWEKLKGFLL